MDMCLLCLELRHESVECIYVASPQWQDNNIAELIEQHFWPLDSIKPNSWICAACFYILNEFHKFYIRVEEAHVDFAMSMKTITTKTTPSPPPQPMPPEQNDFEELIDKNRRSVDIVIKLNEQNMEPLVIQSAGDIRIGKCYPLMQDNGNGGDSVPDLGCPQTYATDYELATNRDTSDMHAEEVQSNDLLVQEELNRLLEESFREETSNLMTHLRSEESEQQQMIEFLDSLSKGFIENNGHNETQEAAKEGPNHTERDENISNGNDETPNKNVEVNTQNVANSRQEGQIFKDMPNISNDTEEISQIGSSENENNCDIPLEKIPNNIKSSPQAGDENKEHENPILNDNPANSNAEKENDEEPLIDKELLLAENDEISSEEENNCNDHTIDEEPITDDESTKLRKRKDPLEKNIFTKIPKIVIKDDPVISEPEKNSNESGGKENDRYTESTQTIDEGILAPKNICQGISGDLKNDTTTDIPESIRKSKRTKKDSANIKLNKVDSNSDDQDREKTESEASYKPNNSRQLRRSLRKSSNNSISSNDFSYNTNTTSYSQISASENENSCDLPMDDITSKDTTNSDSQNNGTEASQLSGDKQAKLTRSEYDSFLAKNFRMYCDICKEESKTFLELRRHFKTVHNERAYVWCCDKKFVRRYPLVEHIRSHSDTYSYKCKYCERVMSTRRCLQLHEKHVHEKEYKRHVCDICGKAFVSACVLKKHKFIHLSDEEKKFCCNECGKRFGSQTLLDDHVRTIHLEKYVKICDICGMVLRRSDAFERHMVKHSDKPINYLRCDICGTRFVNERILKSHMALKHPEGGIVEYTCDICGKVSLNRRNHRRHVQYNHEMTSKYECTLCPKRFKQRTALKEHLAYHSQTPLYTCTYCPMQFISSGNMHSHRKNAHPLEWLEDRRAKYSGKLPPNHIPPSTLPRDESDSTCDS